MADRAVPLNNRAGGGFAASVGLLVLVALFAPLAGLFWRSGGAMSLQPSDVSALEFTLMQAFLSALVSVVLAVPTARALARRRFVGRAQLITLLGAPFLLPVVVAVMGLLALFGRNGILNTALDVVGLPQISIYGLHGVVLAHVFFNLPLATRMLLQGWQAVPAERFRLAAALNMRPASVFRLIEWPMLRSVAPGAFATIFAICLSSFAVALTMGGGPRASTIELAIYQSFRYDFDLGRAATLSVMQLILVGTAAAIVVWTSRSDGLGSGLDRVADRWDAQSLSLRLWDTLVLSLAALFLLIPISLVVLNGASELPNLPQSVWRAALTSLTVAFGSTAICLLLAVPISLGGRLRREAVAASALAFSPLVLGTGAFVLIRPFTSPADWALVVTASVNALMALPFVLRILSPDMDTAERNYGQLADGLSITGWNRVRWIILPRARRALGFSAGLVAALSMGDLGVILLFSDPDRATLPLQMYRLMGAYRMDLAAAAGVLLMAISFALFWIFDTWGRQGVES